VPFSNLSVPTPVPLFRATFFRAAIFRPAVMRVAILRPAVFLRVPVLRAADFRPVVFRAALLRAAVLRAPVLRAAVFRTADFRAAVLRVADFRRAVLRTPVLRGRPGLRVLGITPSSAVVRCIAQISHVLSREQPRRSYFGRHLSIKMDDRLGSKRRVQCSFCVKTKRLTATTNNRLAIQRLDENRYALTLDGLVRRPNSRGVRAPRGDSEPEGRPCDPGQSLGAISPIGALN